MGDLSKHIGEEETDDLLALEKVLKAAGSEDMAKSFRRTKKFVPSRSHPMAPIRFVFRLSRLVICMLRFNQDHRLKQLRD
jgi:hypothetical protein